MFSIEELWTKSVTELETLAKDVEVKFEEGVTYGKEELVNLLHVHFSSQVATPVAPVIPTKPSPPVAETEVAKVEGAVEKEASTLVVDAKADVATVEVSAEAEVEKVKNYLYTPTNGPVSVGGTFVPATGIPSVGLNDNLEKFVGALVTRTEVVAEEVKKDL